MESGSGIGTRRPSTAGGDFFGGVRLLGQGFAMFFRSPRMLLLGAVPALISLVLILAVFGVLLYFIDDLSALATWFADDWDPAARTAARITAGLAILAVAALLSVFTYVALTLIIGDPFYEVISKRVEDRVGGAPTEADVPWHTTLRWNLVDSVRLLAFSLLVSVPMLLLGFLPVVGQTVVPVLNAVLGGWLLALELTGVPFNRRGLRLADRRKILRANRPLALGFGIPVFILLLVPFAALLVMPAAIAGSTLLTRQVLGLPSSGSGSVAPR